MKAFSKGQAATAANLESTGNCLYSYDTLIAVRVRGGAFFTDAKYSQTTSKQSTQARWACEEEGIEVIIAPQAAFDAYRAADIPNRATALLDIFDEWEEANAPRVVKTPYRIRPNLLYGSRQLARS